MTTPCVLFIQGGGKGAYSEDTPLADSLKQALGAKYDVRFPRMPDEADPNVESWKRKISLELSRIHGKLILAAHSVGGSILLKYLTEEKVEKPIAGLFLLAAPSWMRTVGISTTLSCCPTLLRSLRQSRRCTFIIAVMIKLFRLLI